MKNSIRRAKTAGGEHLSLSLLVSRDMYESQKAGESTLLVWTPVYIVLLQKIKFN